MIDTRTGRVKAGKKLRSLLEMHKHPLFLFAVDGDAFRDALVKAHRQYLARPDRQALVSLAQEINGNTTIDVIFSATDVHPAYRASKT